MLIGVLNGSFLTKENVLGNMPFILFCAGLMITYIAYGYHTERIVRDLDRTGTELKELRSEYITVRASWRRGTAEPGGGRDRCAGLEGKPRAACEVGGHRRSELKKTRTMTDQQATARAGQHRLRGRWCSSPGHRGEALHHPDSWRVTSGVPRRKR
jgi:hypothetical protein